MKKLKIATRIQTERQQRSWSQAQLAEASGLSLRTIQRAEATGRCAPETLLALAAAFDLDVREMTALDTREPTWLQKTLTLSFLPEPLFKVLLGWLTILTTFVAVATLVQTFFWPQGTLLWLLARAAVAAAVAGIGIATMVSLVKNFHARDGHTPFFLFLAGILLLFIGAAGLIWSYHQGMVSHDFEYWVIAVDLLLCAQGTLILLRSQRI